MKTANNGALESGKIGNRFVMFKYIVEAHLSDDTNIATLPSLTDNIPNIYGQLRLSKMNVFL